MKNYISISFLFLIVTLFACKKNKTSDTATVLPTNLAVSAIVSTDNSGNVSFNASATNTESFEYDFGNGVFQIVPSGIVTYRYLASGTYTVNVIAKSSTGQTISKSITVTVNVALSLVFADEFNNNGAPDPAKWSYDLGAGGWGNNELQNYTDRIDNVTASGGTLKIIAKREAYSGSAFTSARILTKNKYAFKYGKVECSAKLPAGGGTWPAIWMLGSNINTANWPACGEIDIMEHVGNQLNRIFATMHYTGNSGGGGIGTSTLISNATTAFHKYGMEWNASQIKFYIDDFINHKF